MRGCHKIGQPRIVSKPFICYLINVQKETCKHQVYKTSVASR